MPKRVTGRYERSTVAGEEIAAFIPHPLPPARPALQLDAALATRLRLADQSLARLEHVGSLIPSLDWFIYAFVRKEAVLTSQIEGTQATLVDLFTHEAATTDPTPAHNADIEEVCNYLNALAYARKQLASKRGLPLSMRLLNQTHARLMRGVRGANKQPGEPRRSQNWIGGSRPGNAVYVPPPAHALGPLLTDLEAYIHAPDKLPPLIRAGLIHVQFETIHPYLDGNGRIGRLLIALLLEHWGLLTRPLLYLSVFVKRHQREYYRRLDAVRVEGDWEGWLDFFLDGIATTAEESAATARDLAALVATDRARLLDTHDAPISAVRLLELLPTNPIITTARALTLLNVAKPTALRAIAALEAADILVEQTGKKRDRLWAYARYLDILDMSHDAVPPRPASPAGA